MPLRKIITLDAVIGVEAILKFAFNPSIGPVGVSPSTNVPVLGLVTMVCKTSNRSLKLETELFSPITVLLKPPMVELTVLTEPESAFK